MVDNEYLPKTGAQRIYKIMTNDNDNNIRKYIQDGLLTVIFLPLKIYISFQVNFQTIKNP